jgi:hypothetical protein
MEFLIVLAILSAVVLIVSAPLRRVGGAVGPDARARSRSALGELEAAREAKYREIRDAELDHRTGKLSDSDYEAVDGTLRAEAVQILRAIDAEQARSSASGNGSGHAAAG